MTALVTDSSVLPKWWFDESDAAAARLLRASGLQLIAPDLLIPELLNVVLQKVRSRFASQLEAEQILVDVGHLPIVLTPSLELRASALQLALDFHPSAYDCLYAALALRERCRVVTADRKFYTALAAPHPGTMLWIEDLPEFLASIA